MQTIQTLYKDKIRLSYIPYDELRQKLPNCKFLGHAILSRLPTNIEGRRPKSLKSEKKVAARSKKHLLFSNKPFNRRFEEKFRAVKEKKVAATDHSAIRLAHSFDYLRPYLDEKKHFSKRLGSLIRAGAYYKTREKLSNDIVNAIKEPLQRESIYLILFQVGSSAELGSS